MRPFIAGDTFCRACVYADDSCNPISIPIGVIVTAEMKTSEGNIQLNVLVTDQITHPSVFYIWSEDTANWCGRIELRIHYQLGSIKTTRDPVTYIII